MKFLHDTIYFVTFFFLLLTIKIPIKLKPILLNNNINSIKNPIYFDNNKIEREVKKIVNIQCNFSLIFLVLI